MSGTGESTVDFAGEERHFRIRLGEIRRIQDRCSAGIGEVLRRLSRCVGLVHKHGSGLDALMAGLEIYADDVREPIYQGLCGAGMRSDEATRLVRREIDDRGLVGVLDNAAAALAILWGSQAVPEGEDQPGEPLAGESPAATT